MKKLFLMATIGAALIAVGPASAQVHFGAGPGGVGVEVGPGPHPGWRRDHFRNRFAYYHYDKSTTIERRATAKAEPDFGSECYAERRATSPISSRR